MLQQEQYVDMINSLQDGVQRDKHWLYFIQ